MSLIEKYKANPRKHQLLAVRRILSSPPALNDLFSAQLQPQVEPNSHWNLSVFAEKERCPGGSRDGNRKHPEPFP